MSLIHALETEWVEFHPFGEQPGTMTFPPQRFSLGPRVYLGRRRTFDGFEIQQQPTVPVFPFDLVPRLQLRHLLFGDQPAYKVLLMPPGKYDKFARSVVHPRPYHRSVPLPTVLPNQRRVGLHGILIQVVQNEYIHPVSRQGTFPADRKEFAAAAYHFRHIRRTHIIRPFSRPFYRRSGK